MYGCHGNSLPLAINKKVEFYFFNHDSIVILIRILFSYCSTKTVLLKNVWRHLKVLIDIHFYDKRLLMLTVILKACTEKGVSNEQNIAVCTPLYLNLFVYEVSKLFQALYTSLCLDISVKAQ